MTAAWNAGSSAVEDHPVGDHDDLVEDGLVVGPVELQETIYQFEHVTGVVARIDQDSAQLADAL